MAWTYMRCRSEIAATSPDRAVLDGEALIFRKTAADTALGVLRLS